MPSPAFLRICIGVEPVWASFPTIVTCAADLNTVEGLEFYSHKETPGLGGEVDNPRWKKIWIGKKVYNNNKNVSLEVIKGAVNPQDQNIDYKVDGLSGATLTSRGVTNMLAYWFGESGYSKLLEQLNYES